METKLTIKAQLVAELVHAQQKDKAGNAYIDHPRRVVLRVAQIPTFPNLTFEQQEAAICAAWMHDVLEDSGTNGFPPVLKSDLIAWGFTPVIVSAVELLSRSIWIDRNTQIDRPKDTYYSTVAGNLAAHTVKIADIADNRNEHRLNKVAEPKRGELIQKYAKAVEALDPPTELKEWLEVDIKKVY